MSAQNTFFNFRTCTGYSFAHPISDCTQLSAVWPPQISKKSHPELLHLLPCRTIEHRCVRAIVAVYPVHAHGEGWQQVTKWHPYTSEILPSEVDASQNIGVEPVKPESISFPNTVFKEISLIGSLASCISRVCTAALCATTEQLWQQRGWPVLQVAQVYEYQMRLSACITIFRRKGGTKCDDFKLQLWSYFWKPRFTVTEIHQETQVLHQRAIFGLKWRHPLTAPGKRPKPTEGLWKLAGPRSRVLSDFSETVRSSHISGLGFGLPQQQIDLQIESTRNSHGKVLFIKFLFFRLMAKKTNIGSIFQLVQWYWIPKTCMPPRLLLNLQMSLPPSGWQWT